MMAWSADEVHLTDDDVHVGIGATAREVLGRVNLWYRSTACERLTGSAKYGCAKPRPMMIACMAPEPFETTRRVCRR